MKEDLNKNFNIDSILNNIREHKKIKCPKCGEELLYQAKADLSKIFCVYCNTCRFSVKMTYK